MHVNISCIPFRLEILQICANQGIKQLSKSWLVPSDFGWRQACTDKKAHKHTHTHVTANANANMHSFVNSNKQ